MIGSKMDSGGTSHQQQIISFIFECWAGSAGTLLLSFLYHFFRRVVSLLIVSSTSINLSSSSVTISEGMGLESTV